MAANKNLLILPGDGIGPEVMGQVRRVVDWMDRRRAVTFDITEDRVGGAAINRHGTTLDDEWGRFFKEHGFLIGISLDGPREIHDRYRVTKLPGSPGESQGGS